MVEGLIVVGDEVEQLVDALRLDKVLCLSESKRCKILQDLEVLLEAPPVCAYMIQSLSKIDVHEADKGAFADLPGQDFARIFFR